MAILHNFMTRIMKCIFDCDFVQLWICTFPIKGTTRFLSPNVLIVKKGIITVFGKGKFSEIFLIL